MNGGTVAADGGGATSHVDGRTARRLRWLMRARLVLSVGVLAVSIGLDALGRSLEPAARSGLYGTVLAAFAATGVSLFLFRRLRSAARFAVVQLAVDVALVTALVLFTGGRESLFTFLYVCVTVYGAVLFERRGAFGAATLSALGYGGVLVAAHTGVDVWPGGEEHAPLSVLWAVWGVHVGALFLVGALASVLSGELQRTGAVLDQRTQDLHRLRDLHLRTVESIMSGLVTTDSALRVTSFNPEAVRITGRNASEVLGRDVDAVIPGARELLNDPALAGEGTSGVSRARLGYRDRRGQELSLGLAGSTLKDADGTPDGWVLIFQDVTKIVEMEAELRRSERMAAVGELSAKIAHEIRNPLAAISGSIEILRASHSARRPGAEDEQDPARLMEIVLRETERLNQLITDFLGYARPRPPKLEPVDLGELISEVAEMLQASQPPGITVHCLAEAGMRAVADADQLRQVMWNLCSNGVEAMPDGGELALEVRAVAEAPQGLAGERRNRTGGHGAAAGVELVVRDTGCGMDSETRERMFEPFFTSKERGTGLGLATVHRIIESHGGSLQITSVVGEGSCFRVQLASADSGEGAQHG